MKTQKTIQNKTKQKRNDRSSIRLPSRRTRFMICFKTIIRRSCECTDDFPWVLHGIYHFVGRERTDGRHDVSVPRETRDSRHSSRTSVFGSSVSSAITPLPAAARLFSHAHIIIMCIHAAERGRCFAPRHVLFDGRFYFFLQ